VCSSGYSVCRGGSRGGRLGGGFLAPTSAPTVPLPKPDPALGGNDGEDGDGDADPVPSMRLTGGFGKLAVERPVVSVLYGAGGGLGLFSSSCSAAT